MLLLITGVGCVARDEGVAGTPSIADLADDSGTSDTSGGDTGHSDTGHDTTADPDDALGCVNLRSGPWWGVGLAFGMPMTVTLNRATGSCSFLFEEWSMQHGSVPTGGTVEEDRVSFEGPAPWPACQATVTSSRSFAGDCGEGETLEFSYDG